MEIKCYQQVLLQWNPLDMHSLSLLVYSITQQNFLYSFAICTVARDKPVTMLLLSITHAMCTD